MNIKENTEHILSLKNKHEGERCFMIGLGPSLNEIDFELIKNETLFDVNNFFEFGYDKFKVKPEYTSCTDPLTWKSYGNKLLQLDTTLFLSGSALSNYLSNYLTYKLNQYRDPVLIRHLGFMWIENNFSTDLLVGAYNGDTVIIDISLQAAYWMGFNEVILIGCDCDFSGQHHFDGTLTEPINAPAARGDWSRIFRSYEICKKFYEADGKEIINATVGGKLEIFKRKSLEEIMR